MGLLLQNLKYLHLLPHWRCSLLQEASPCYIQKVSPSAISELILHLLALVGCLGIPVPVWIAAVVVLFAVFITQQTKLGRYIYAIGGNETAAKFSGINITKVKITVYAMAGALAAIGGIIVTSRLDSAQPNAGTSYELDAIAAVVIGGTSLSGGKGTVWGTVMGAIIIGVLNNGLVLLNVSPFWQQVVKGGVILLAVIIDKLGEKKE